MVLKRWCVFSILLAAAGCGGGSESAVVPGTGGSGGTMGTVSTGGTAGFTFPGNDDAGMMSITDANVCPGGVCPDPVGDAMPVSQCGNGVIEADEVCDDMNAMPGDGCSGLCRLEPNFRCPVAGEPCLSTVACGDGMVGGKEGCDDKNLVSGDGCNGSCQVEPGYGCATPGEPCTKTVTVECGDRVVNMGETCDDGGKLSGDGCSKDCQLETGFSCPTPGEACVADEFCGNGNLADTEQCDDGNGNPGDGCTGLCQKEPFFVCPMPGKPCQSTIVCGDSKVIGDEACDDGDMSAGDGCAADCKSTEPGFTCPTASGVGGACIAVPTDRCGDGRLSIGEFCDDGNTDATDGCTDVCQVTPGYTCPAAGMSCMLIEWCGDGKLSLVRGEECDDGDAVGGDGCSATCVREANFVCPQPGMDCVSTVRCGDGIVSGNETCDDRDLDAGDGCNQNCQVELGWVCPAGAACRAERCGDGLIAGTEKCDDGDADSGDGCSAVCQVELPGPTEGNGWVCSQPGQACVRTTCGNGVREGSEQCDDGDNDTGDGCGPLCRNEPLCAGGPCVTQCGDGLLLAIDKQNGQQCDDGNTVSGDGCSDTCKIEAGFVCTDTIVSANPLILPIVYRDFKAYENPGGQVEFQWSSGDPIDRTPTEDIWARTTLGTAADTLPNGTSLLGKPIFKWYVSCDGTGCANLTPAQGQSRPASTLDANTCNGFKGAPTGARDMTQWGRPVFFCGYGAQDFLTFSQWYRDVPSVNQTLVSTLSLNRLGNGSYQYSSTSFFPIDGQGFGNENWTHNYHFTSEVRYWFEYKAADNATLTFFGDDDVWVFVGGKLVVDISGTHGQVQDGVTLNANTNDIDGNRLNLVDGSVYEIVVFQAERNCCGSNYQLTLSNFSSTRSSCQSVCGDGVVTANESCDLGTANNTGAYGTCNANCTLPPRCGDNIAQAASGEACDDGSNLATYSTGQLRCGPGCQWAPRCGDGMVDGAHGEACDEAADNGKGYGYCTAACQLGPRCGDKITSNGEQCDDGSANGNSQSACTATCTLKCGNGMVDGGEQCDDGAANTGGYGKCNSNCTLGPRCGDGIKSTPEQCDDGKNDGTYGTCAPMCLLGARCGDGTVQDTAGEICDLGTAQNTGGYGKGLCTAQCRPAPYCGNKSVDIGFGEKCDDGVNSGLSGSCTPDCAGWVALPECGDGNLDAGEQCDDGLNVNGSAGSMCDVRCRKKCGNGFVDAGEQCDNGQNDGSYGTCTTTCQLADYCGDGKKNGAEECDLGAAGNQAAPYGINTCTTLCTRGPYCGDGRIQPAHEEQCDGQAGCNPTTCTWPIPE